MQNKAKKVLYITISTFVWVGIWEILSLIVGSEVILPSPLTAFLRLTVLISKFTFWKCILNSVLHILSGFIIALIIAVILSAAASRSKIIFEFLSPLMRVIKATPVASFIVLALIWLKSGVATFIAMLMVVPLIYSNSVEGYKNVDTKLIEVSKIYGFSAIKKIKLIYLPSLMPYFVSACSVGLGFAWKAGIAAEVIGLPKDTLGLEIYNAKTHLETADLFALTVVIIVLSLIMEKAVMFLLKKLSEKIAGGSKR